MVSDLDDAAALQAWREGDRAAGQALVRRHMPLVYRFFSNKVARDDLEDLAQKTFLGCVGGRDRIDDRGLRAYLLGIARNQLLMHYRGLGRAAADPAQASVQQLVDEHSLGGAVLARDDHRLLLAALRRLPVDLQLTIELFYWEDITLAEIAAITAVPVGTVKSRLDRAKHGLREHLRSLPLSPRSQRGSVQDFEAWVRTIRGTAGPGD